MYHNHYSPVVFYLFLGVTSSVRIRVLDVPEMAQAGHNVHLTCDYDLERQSLYTIKWYKGTHEFYRYSPNEESKTKLFLVENLNVDVSRSDERTVVLKNLHIDMTGLYTCEVSTEGIFETRQKSAKMTVIALPPGGPHIQGYHREVETGETVTLNCTSLKSKPAAELTFYINDKNASELKKVSMEKYLIVNEEDNPQTESSILSMTFRVRKQLIKEAKIQIRCEATIMKIYRREKVVEMYVKTHSVENLATPENRHSGSSCQQNRLATWSRLICLCIFILCLKPTVVN